MAKPRSLFVCQQCGAAFPKWMGKCSECGEWNSLVETTQFSQAESGGAASAAIPQKLTEIKTGTSPRIPTTISELDRVLGDGVVPGSVILVAGEPGIGKSTLLLQLVAKTGGLYVSGEESLTQIKLRAQRLGVSSAPNLLFLAQTEVEVIAATIEAQKDFKLVVVDSVQTLVTNQLTGMAGSVGQVRESAAYLARVAKRKGIPLFLVGHVTKQGAIAGPKVLEHLVDTVIYLEGERFGAARLLRATKNRFGATDEVGVFEMSGKGMEPVTNPSKLFLKERVKKVPGSVVTATMEGTRPLLVEIQALVVPTQIAIPRRVGQGVSYPRLQMIVAVLTKMLRLPLAGSDVYVNITGGIRIEEPAADLGIALAIVSSFKNIAVDTRTVCFGELGLLGEIRAVAQEDKRAKEARRLGFTTIISPQKFSFINQAAKALG